MQFYNLSDNIQAQKVSSKEPKQSCDREVKFLLHIWREFIREF